MSRARVAARRSSVLAACTAGAAVVLAGTAPAGVASAGAQTPRASVAGSYSLSESAHLHLTSKHGFTLNEQGSVSGTIDGAIYIHLHIVSVDRVSAEVNIYPRGGSISGYASASYHAAGATASFSGSMSVSRGSGGYDHAHGSSLSFSGTIARSNDAVTVRLSGHMST
ncbi:MAG TPA: hypothetical protein VMF09_13920 [Solirubrobacteraceae bacterium]|nr:hypothetical protein [Solirubrobacteraceae bacterium]